MGVCIIIGIENSFKIEYIYKEITNKIVRMKIVIISLRDKFLLYKM